MRVSNLLKPESILLRAEADTPEDVLETLVELQENNGVITNGTACFNAVYDRERIATTAIGEGIALPHACNAGVAQPGVAALTLRHGMDWGAGDSRPVDLFFMVAVPVREESARLQILARLVNLLSDDALVAELRRAASREKFLRLLSRAESDRFA